MTKNIILHITALLLITLFPSSHGWEKRIDAHGKTIIAYYASWQWYDRDGLAKPSNLDHSKVTRYNFAFFQIDSGGEIWGTDSWADAITLYGEFDWSAMPGVGVVYCSWDGPGEAPACAGHHYETGLISQAHNAGVEVYPSIGGWTLSDPFPALAANSAARQKFAENCVKLIETYDFDGIDIDWEYPGYADHMGTPADTVNYSLFLQAIRDALNGLGERTGRFYGLTAALPCGPDLIGNIQIDIVSDILTELNLMTYDFHGSWNKETGVNAPLYDMDGSPEFSVHGCVENWKDGGGSPGQINIGLPFYGRSFAGVGLTGMGQVHSGYADTTTWSDDEGSPQYFNIVDKLAQFATVRDVQTKTQYAYNNAGLVSYDDELAICDKTEYAMDHNLNGYIIWEISGDLLPDLSTPLLDATNDRLNNPSIPCEPDAVVMGTVSGESWYPSQSLGLCVNDGKQLENFIGPHQIFGSAESCCAAIYNHRDDCVPSSLDPGSDGRWVDGVMKGDPWYPSQNLGLCVNDGKQLENFISPDQMFGSAKSCCAAIYNHRDDCVPSSLDPGSDGRWVDGVVEGDPWYQHPTAGYCVNDGKHKQNFIETYQMFSSADSCCDANFSFNTDCVSESMNPTNEGKWYPSGSSCTAQSPIPSWITHAFDSEQECCREHFEYHDSCVTGTSQVQVVTLQPPKKPNNMDDIEDKVITQPTPQQTPRPTRPKPNNTGNNGDSFINEYALAEFLFYPHYGDEGTSVECRNDGNAPEWITKNMMKSSKYECCTSYSPPSWTDQCNADNPYYPNFQDTSCVNDGNHPGWMVGDYLVDNMWLCCHNFFHDEELLQQCTGIPACADCDLTDYFNTDGERNLKAQPMAPFKMAERTSNFLKVAELD